MNWLHISVTRRAVETTRQKHPRKSADSDVKSDRFVYSLMHCLKVTAKVCAIFGHPL